ncbi:hypothetical protein [Allobaculum sp. Allo2]|uniref:hypothetical protein n=1 Tax=Allobaculum sp. Allo2 TaxID=2853432 RepID=UPI001F5FF735|nr:hypothetical protein [Allobaculum sp. Allo2]UNT92707.1 hypothetical protein KWG61_11400 [Allobaculum sp. Allo2]
MASAHGMENQMPSTPQTAVKIRMKPTWNTSERTTEMMAETGPSLSAVKKPDPKSKSWKTGTQARRC